MALRTNGNNCEVSTTEGFDYASLAASARKQIEEEVRAIRRLLVNTASNIVQIGLRLQFVRNCIGREHFQAWLKAEFQWSQSVASNYMRAAAVFRDVDCLDRFQPSALYVLSRHKASEAARTEALQRACAGEMITKSCADLIIRKYKDVHLDRRFNVVTEVCRIAGRLESMLARLSPEEMGCISKQLATLRSRLQAAGLVLDAAELPQFHQDGAATMRTVLIDQNISGK